jgi:hypothetical protein
LERYYFAYSVAHKNGTAIIGANGSNGSNGAAHIYNLFTDGDTNSDGELDECECDADVSGDEVVDVHDLLILIANWGTSPQQGDVNNDAIVDIEDLLIVVAAWGPCE